MTAVRIIGIGSPHGMDSIGWRLLAALREAGWLQRFAPGLVSLEHCAVPAGLYPLLDGCRLAILVDAAALPVASVQVFGSKDLAERDDLFSVHGVGVAEMLALAQVLLEPPPEVRVLGVGIGNGLQSAQSEPDLLPFLAPVMDRLTRDLDTFFASRQSPDDEQRHRSVGKSTCAVRR